MCATTTTRLMGQIVQLIFAILINFWALRWKYNGNHRWAIFFASILQTKRSVLWETLNLTFTNWLKLKQSQKTSMKKKGWKVSSISFLNGICVFSSLTRSKLKICVFFLPFFLFGILFFSQTQFTVHGGKKKALDLKYF